jgi:hypothetical protein
MKITVVRQHQQETAPAADSNMWLAHQKEGQCGCDECAPSNNLSFCLFCSGNCAAGNAVRLAPSAADGLHDELRPPLS